MPHKTDMPNCCCQHWSSAASRVSLQLWSPPWQQRDITDMQTHVAKVTQTSFHYLRRQVYLREICWLFIRDVTTSVSARIDTTWLRQCFARRSAVLSHLPSMINSYGSCQRRFWLWWEQGLRYKAKDMTFKFKVWPYARGSSGYC